MAKCQRKIWVSCFLFIFASANFLLLISYSCFFFKSFSSFPSSSFFPLLFPFFFFFMSEGRFYSEDHYYFPRQFQGNYKTFLKQGSFIGVKTWEELAFKFKTGRTELFALLRHNLQRNNGNISCVLSTCQVLRMWYYYFSQLQGRYQPHFTEEKNQTWRS